MSSKIEQSLQLIKAQGYVPLFFYPDEKVCIEVLDIIYEAGLRIIEYTNRGPESLSNFKSLIQYRNTHYPDLQIGIGTIKFESEVFPFLEAGADFVSSPGVMKEVADIVNSAGILWIPGCMTITEIIQAEANGAQLVKLCPASLLKSTFLIGIKNIFPKLSFMPMGGLDIDRNDLAPWFDAGAVAVSIGSRLLGRLLLENKAYELVRARLTKATYIIQTLKEYRKTELEELKNLQKYDHI